MSFFPRPFLLALVLVAPARADEPLLRYPAGAAVRAGEPFRYPEGKHGKGELRYIDKVPVLFLEGTPQEMGEQAGVLVLKPAAPLLKEIDRVVETWGWGKAYPLLLKTASFLGTQFPPDHLAELDAAAKASGWPRELLIFGNCVSDLSRLTGCSALLVEPARSDTGAMLFGRNLDWPPAANLHDYPLAVVYKPKGKRAFVSASYPGIVGCISGMNDAGLVVADLTVLSTKDGAPSFDVAGTPSMLNLRRVLEECATVEDAEKLLRSAKRTVLENIAICDTKRAAVFELTSKSLIVRPAADGLCSCTNHFRSTELATATKCSRFDALEKSRGIEKLSLKDVAKHMDDANQGPMTLQTMIFEPAGLRLHLAFGAGPATKLPLRTLDLKRALGK